MNVHCLRKSGVLLALACTLCVPALSAARVGQQWNFDVYLDGDEIGYHHFTLRQSAGKRELHSEARFKVRILAIPVYRYSHEAREIWNGDCLQAIQSSTDDNGEQLSLQGRTADGQLLLTTGKGKQALDGCVMSFAYWDPRILQAEKLLNAQNGEYLDVSVDKLGEERLALSNGSVIAQRYQLTGEDLQIDLWYSPDQQWLGLQSTTPSGRVLTYRKRTDNDD